MHRGCAVHPDPAGICSALEMDSTLLRTSTQREPPSNFEDCVRLQEHIISTTSLGVEGLPGACPGGVDRAFGGPGPPDGPRMALRMAFRMGLGATVRTQKILYPKQLDFPLSAVLAIKLEQ